MTGSTDQRQLRPVCETMPALNLDAALRAARDGVTLIGWFENMDAPIGTGSLLQLPGQFQLTYQIRDKPKAYVVLNEILASNGVTNRRRRMVCLGCNLPISTAYFYKARWRCRKCHGLGYSSQQRDPAARLVRDYDALMVQANRARRDGEHLKSYEARGAEARAALARLKQTPHTMVDGRPTSSALHTDYRG